MQNDPHSVNVPVVSVAEQKGRSKGIALIAVAIAAVAMTFVLTQRQPAEVFSSAGVGTLPLNKSSKYVATHSVPPAQPSAVEAVATQLIDSLRSAPSQRPCPSAPSLVFLTGRPRGRSVENALRQVAAPLCARVVSLQPPEACTLSDRREGAWNEAHTLHHGTLDGETGAEELFASENGVDARLHVEDRGECVVRGSSTPLFPFYWFNWTVERLCVPRAHWSGAIALAAARLGVNMTNTFVVDVRDSTTFGSATEDFRDPDVDADQRATIVRRSPCRDRMFCQPGAAVRACSSRRQAIGRIRREIANQDAFATLHSFAGRYRNTSSSLSVSGRLEVPVLADSIPTSCTAARSGRGVGGRPPTLAIGLTGFPRMVGKNVRRMMRYTGGFDVFFFAHLVVDRFPLSNSDRQQVRAVAALPNLLGLLVTASEDFANFNVLRGDHPNNGEYKRLYRETPIARTLAQFYNFAVTNLMRRMYEARCGVRFDLTARMRTDTYFMHPLNASWALDSETVLIDAERAPYPRSINDQFSVGPPWLLDRVLDIYFRLATVTPNGLHAETSLLKLLEDDGVIVYVKQPPFRMVERHAYPDEPAPTLRPG